MTSYTATRYAALRGASLNVIRRLIRQGAVQGIAAVQPIAKHGAEGRGAADRIS